MGSSLENVPPDHMFWSDASDLGWGARLMLKVTSGQWSPLEKDISINLKELIAIRLGLQFFLPQVSDQVVAVFSENATAIAYLRKQGDRVS